MSTTGHRTLTLVILLTVVSLASTPVVRACFYSPVDNDTQGTAKTSIDDVLAGKYEEAQKLRDVPSRLAELRRVETELRSKGEDPDTLDAYAMALHHLNRNGEAEDIWRKLLASEKDRFVTLCNYGTFCELNGRFEEAADMIKHAAELRPGFRDGAETLHARRLAALRDQRARALATARESGGARAADFWLPEFMTVLERPRNAA